jgi:hypothetical protein
VAGYLDIFWFFLTEGKTEFLGAGEPLAECFLPFWGCKAVKVKQREHWRRLDYCGRVLTSAV